VQNAYSLLNRQDEVSVVDLCQREGIRYQAYSPLAGGWLTGKYLDRDIDPRSRYIVAPDLAGVELDEIRGAMQEMRFLADGEGISVTALALAWVNTRPFVDSIVVGPRCAAHLDAVREGMSVTLSHQAQERLDVLFPLREP
jgi:aryl-alcohol dehydrogenase-like predicted oxidoreductase